MSSIPTKQIDGDVAVGRNVSAGGDANIQGNARIGHDLIVEGWLEAKNIKGVNKGLFASVGTLREAYPHPHDGWFAGVSASDKDISDLGLTVQQGKSLFRMYIGSGGDWVCEPINKLYEISVDIKEINNLRNDLSNLSKQYDKLDTRITDSENSIQTISNNIGKPNGIAPLDSNTKISPAYIPAAVHDVAEYTGDVGGNITVDNATATAPFNVYWVAESQGKGRFAARGEISYVGEPYHADWPGRERWCDSAGLPLSGKLYRRLNDNALLARDAEGNALVPVAAGTDIEDVDTALLAREWLAYVEWGNPANITFDPDGHPDAPFGIYNLWLTTAEAHAVLREGMERGSDITGYHFSSAAPTALTPKRTSGNETYYLMQSAATLPGGRAGELCYACCRSLRTIWGEVTRVDGSRQFTECYALENVTFMLDSWCENFSLADSPLLSYDTMKSLAVNTPQQSGNRTLVITVHADVYAKLTGDMSNSACASLSPEMRDLWAELLDEAASKNIIFAT